MQTRICAVAVLLFLSACSSKGDEECGSSADCPSDHACQAGACKLVVTTDDVGTQDGAGSSDSGTRDVSVDGTAQTDSSTPDVGTPDMPCVPQCGTAVCGSDPVCGTPCGTCPASTTCDNGMCVAIPVFTTWSLNGAPVHSSNTADAVYTAADDRLTVFISRDGRNLQMVVDNVSTTASLTYSCADEPGAGSPMSFNTVPGATESLPDVPDNWKDLMFSGADCAGANPDALSTFSFDLTAVATDHVTGSVSIEIAGGGPRSGETLRVSSQFDVDTRSQ